LNLKPHIRTGMSTVCSIIEHILNNLKVLLTSSIHILFYYTPIKLVMEDMEDMAENIIV